MNNTKILLCMHSISSLLPYYNALRVCPPDNLGIGGINEKSKGYIQCSDPSSYTGGGTAIFEIIRTNDWYCFEEHID